MRRIAALIIGLALLTACSDFSQEREQVAQLTRTVGEQQERLQTLHPDSLPMNSAMISGKIKQITDNYTARQVLLSKDLSLMLADFKVFTKVFKGLPQKRMRLRQELEISAEQLGKLDTDLKEGALTEDKAAQYIADERQVLSDLTATMDQLDTLMARGARGYIRMLPRIDSVIAQLEPLPSEQ